MKTAIFTVTRPETNEVVMKYELEYATLADLQADFKESRQVWSEFNVTAECDECELSASHTWRDEFLATMG